MVQVDIFWSYGIGAGLAVAAHRQIKTMAKAEDSAVKAALESPYFTQTLLFLSLIFVPSGMWLLWAFPSWETMHAGDRNLPVALVGLFSITNISQGILGYVLCQELIRRDKVYAAWLNFVGAYLGFFFILIHGWDGEGYKRFFSASPDVYQDWNWSVAGDWFQSDVAVTLYGMSLVFLPSLLGLTIKWLNVGRQGPSNLSEVSLGFLGSIFGAAFGGALLAALLCMQFGFAVGALISVGVLYLLALPRIGLGHTLFRWMIGRDQRMRTPFDAAPTV